MNENMLSEGLLKDAGYLYVAVGAKYLREAEISARSLRRYTQLPICIYTDVIGYKNLLFDIVITADNINGSYGNKINGLISSPFYKTIFLDGDTFICSSIDSLFNVLDLFDMSMMPDPLLHSYLFLKKKPGFTIPYEGLIPEYQTSVMVMKKNNAVMQLLSDWLSMHDDMNIVADMPTFREAYLKHVGKVSINPLPIEYDYNGTMTFGMLYHKVKIIHEKIHEKRSNLRLMMASFEDMEKHAARLNRFPLKRLVLPYFGTIPFYYSPYIIKKRIKKFFGVRRRIKDESF